MKMKIKIAVCEDCQKDADLLCEQLSRYCQESGLPTYDVDIYPNGFTFSKNCLPGSYDLIFMDIYLEQDDGMRLAQNFRKADKECPIVFFTRNTDHAVEAFKVNAAHYLTKPLAYENLAEALDRCLRLHERQSKFILLPTEKAVQKIRVAEIVYIEVFNNISVVHLKRETVSSRISLKNLLMELTKTEADAEFLRCHRSYMVNMNWIRALKSDFFLMDTGIPVPISKYMKKQVICAYEEFALKQIRDTQTIPATPKEVR